MSEKLANFRMGRGEFVALIAMMFATIAFSLDAMLPALPDIAAELSPELANRAPLILTAFVFGMGVGTFIAGPLSDAFGRRRVIFFSAILYTASAALAYVSWSLEVLLIARVLQGLGASGPRIVAVAIVRDLFSGREMAKIVSLVMLIFTLVPAFAPLMGMVIINVSGWRGIFMAFIVFSTVTVLWMGLRLPETLAVEDRRPLRWKLMFAAVGEMFSNRTVMLSIFVQTLAMAMLFTTLMLVQPIYEQVYNRAESFPYWFGAVAVVAGTSSLLNARLVVQFGMRHMVTSMLGWQVFITALMLIFNLGDLARPYGFGAFVFWQTCLFFQAGLTLGNLNAIAMEPMGHIAGMAASIIGALATVMAAAIASPVGLFFDGTIIPLMVAVLVMAAVGFGLMILMGAESEETQPEAAE
ncbi:MFS transporter [Sulfitobacter sp. JB4-11]|uniref:MFS transporter n=1 Tax=Sulfitobacter rhodophyticola TaxID=3238304 RepID=UPI0035158B50